MRQLLVYRRQGNAAPYRCPVMPACAAACCWWWGGCSCRNRAALDSSNSNVAAAQPRGSLVVDDAVAAGGCRKVPPVGMHPETVVTLGWREDFSRMSPDRGCSAMNRCTLGQPISGHRVAEGRVSRFFFQLENFLPSPGSQQRTLKRLFSLNSSTLLSS